MPNIIKALIGLVLFTGVLACEHTMNKSEWQEYTPGKIITGILAGAFIIWIMWVAHNGI